MGYLYTWIRVSLAAAILVSCACEASAVEVEVVNLSDFAVNLQINGRAVAFIHRYSTVWDETQALSLTATASGHYSLAARLIDMAAIDSLASAGESEGGPLHQQLKKLTPYAQRYLVASLAVLGSTRLLKKATNALNMADEANLNKIYQRLGQAASSLSLSAVDWNSAQKTLLNQINQIYQSQVANRSHEAKEYLTEQIRLIDNYNIESSQRQAFKASLLKFIDQSDRLHVSGSVYKKIKDATREISNADIADDSNGLTSAFESLSKACASVRGADAEKECIRAELTSLAKSAILNQYFVATATTVATAGIVALDEGGYIGYHASPIEVEISSDQLQAVDANHKLSVIVKNRLGIMGYLPFSCPITVLGPQIKSTRALILR